VTLRRIRYALGALARRVADHVRRPVCRAVGCRCSDEGEPVCVRCGEHIYDGWLFWGWTDEVRWFLARLAFRRAKCPGCGKRFGRWRRGRLLIEFCSDPACERDWIPF
jgi:hypothetical protein